MANASTIVKVRRAMSDTTVPLGKRLQNAIAAIRSCMDALVTAIAHPEEPMRICELSLELTDAADLATDFPELWEPTLVEEVHELLLQAAEAARNTDYEIRVSERAADFLSGIRNAEAATESLAKIPALHE